MTSMTVLLALAEKISYNFDFDSTMIYLKAEVLIGDMRKKGLQGFHLSKL